MPATPTRTKHLNGFVSSHSVARFRRKVCGVDQSMPGSRFVALATAELTFSKREAENRSIMSTFSKRILPISFCLMILMVPSFTGCRRRASTDDETPDTSTYRPESTPATQFERDLKYVRDAHFTYVWIFSRKDGKELTKEDSDALRTNAPKVVDWVTTDEKKKVIAGSNFSIEGPQLAALQKRFNIEDYSGK